MPGLIQKNAQIGNASSNLSTSGSVVANGIWSKQRTDASFDQLQKFWGELSPHARHELLKIDKQTLFEQARKNLYCSRCNGLLLEGFSQIIMYGKSLQQEDVVQDPSVHPWGGLATTRDGILTLLDCFLDGKSLKPLQNVFDSARARERERELLYPDACGGGGRGWISQGTANYGKGHGTRETCALHTARLSCDTLVDFWSALGDETRQSLLRMKEEDFIERLMYRFDSKRFCRDCRKNVIREFKELKELKRMKREPRCTDWFCVADTAFEYEVSVDAVQADWHQSFIDAVGSYHHFEWAIGTSEGKSDILEFENVGMNDSAQANGLDLGGLTSCFITLRAWKLDGRCTELSVKAHALKGQPCVHRRLIVGEGFVTITKGESIRRFFEHAEEAEEEEDDDSMDKDGSDPDGDGSRPQKHAKSPELAREFLLDAATVIFRDQVEKAFREGTARQNAHSIFVCLALKLLEERVHVACKEIITLEKQMKLLEEEEKEKREEEERKERRRTKEREKKLRRKERLKGKDKKCAETKQLSGVSDLSSKESSLSALEDQNSNSTSGDSISETGENTLSSPLSPSTMYEQSSNGFTDFQDERLEEEEDSSEYHLCSGNGDHNLRDCNGSFMTDQSKSSRRKLRLRKDLSADLSSRWCDRRRPSSGNDGYVGESCGYVLSSMRNASGIHRQIGNKNMKSCARNCGPKFEEKRPPLVHKIRSRYDSHSCSCTQHSGYKPKDGSYLSITRTVRDLKNCSKLEAGLEVSIKPLYQNRKFNNGCLGFDVSAMPKSKVANGSIPSGRGEVIYSKKVWEPMESRKRCPRSSSDTGVTLRSFDGTENGLHQSKSLEEKCTSEFSVNSGKTVTSSNPPHNECGEVNVAILPSLSSQTVSENGFGLGRKSNCYLKTSGDEVGVCTISSTDPILTSSSSDNCSSSSSEGESTAGSLGAQNGGSSCTSDSEDTSPQSEGSKFSSSAESLFFNCQNDAAEGKVDSNEQESFRAAASCTEISFTEGRPPEDTEDTGKGDNVKVIVDMGPQKPEMVHLHNQSVHVPMFPAPTSMGFYHQTPASWATGPANGLFQLPQSNHYLFGGPVGYGLTANGSPHVSLQYGTTLQSVATHMINVNHVPLYQTAKDCLTSKDQADGLAWGRSKEAAGVPAASVSERAPKGQLDDKLLIQKGNLSCKDGSRAKLINGLSNFSLFHFGGPVATPLKEEGSAEISSKSVGAPVHVDVSYPEKEKIIEEYSLFAAGNGSKFPFF